MDLSPSQLSYMDAHQQEGYDLLLKLAQIPAPSHHEEQRANFCKSWLEKQGAKGVYIDSACNVIYPLGCTETNDLNVVLAHSDVVFPDTDPLPLRVADGKIYCPGVGDDTANAVAILMTAKYIAEHNLTPKGQGVLLVINAAEEGLGDLKGSRQLIKDFGPRIREFIALDAHDCLGVSKAVGSKRFRVEIDTEGGHSFTAFGNRNAIATLASMIDALYAIKVPEKGTTTYNVGLISGGTSVNTIAQHAEMLYEFRSDEKESLEIMERHFNAAVEFYRTKGVTITVTPVGDRPCSGVVDPQRQQVLTQRASDALLHHYGKPADYGPGSTDCNVALAAGIPSICVGCYFGDLSHTRQEYVVIDSLLPGLKVAMELILHYF